VEGDAKKCNGVLLSPCAKCAPGLLVRTVK
jgi:hypothetical protein